jgi:hypothetical protein
MLDGKVPYSDVGRQECARYVSSENYLSEMKRISNVRVRDFYITAAKSGLFYLYYPSSFFTLRVKPDTYSSPARRLYVQKPFVG